MTPSFVLAAAVAAVLVFNPAWADPRAGAAESDGPVVLDEYAARRVAHIAVIDNRQVVHPGPADFEITSLLLGSAQRILPGDPALIRMRLAAAITGGDQDTTIEQTRKLIAVNPDDTVAQLRLISHIINQQQTVEGRIAVVERFLGPAGARIPAEVRSRLALDAALWYRDRGDDDAFVRSLVLATTLDSTNKLAAYMAANYFAATIDDPVGRLELLVNLLLSDPFDPQTHVAIATELSNGGAFKQALRFQQNALILAQSMPNVDVSHIIRGELLLIWHVQGPEAAVTILNDRLALARDAIARKLRDAEASGKVVIDPPDPGDQNLSFSDERVRMLAASAAGDSATAAAAIVAMGIAIPQYVDQMEEQDLPSDQIELNRSVLETEFALTRLWIGLDVQNAIADAEKLIERYEGLETDADAVRLLGAFVAVRNNEPDLALDLLGELTQESIFGDVGRGLALAAQGDAEAVREILAGLVVAHPVDPVGVWALTKLKGANPNANPLGRGSDQLAMVARSVPSWLDRMLIRPGAFMTLRVEAIGTTKRALDRGGLRVRIRNTSTIPLGVGPDRPINTILLFAPNIDIDLSARMQFASEVIDGARRLRLAPREELVFDVWPSYWPGSAVVDIACSHSTRVRTRIIQGFVPSKEVGYQPGPLCLDADAPTIVLTPLAQSVLGFDKLIEHLRSDPEEAITETLAVLMGWLAYPTAAQQPLAPEQIAEFIQAVTDRYPSLSPAGKLLMLSTLPTAARMDAMAPFDEVALQETDPLAMPLVLLTRATDAEHPIFRRAAESGDELVIRLAALLQARLRSEGYAFSTVTNPETGG